jgi:hypothetical protein
MDSHHVDKYLLERKISRRRQNHQSRQILRTHVVTDPVCQLPGADEIATVGEAAMPAQFLQLSENSLSLINAQDPNRLTS